MPAKATPISRSKPAILGGTPLVQPGMRAKWPVYDDAERNALLRVLNSGKWWRGGTRGWWRPCAPASRA